MPWEFFENLDEYVYASDADTYELLYMNRKMRETLGVSSVEEIKGQRCHEVLQDSALPCTMCNNEKLEPDQFTEWRYFNPMIGRSLLIKDTLTVIDGRRIRVELALDTSKENWQSAQLTLRRDLAATVNEGLRVALRAELPDQSLSIVVEFLGKALHGKRAFIFERDPDGTTDNTYEWIAKGMLPEKDHLQGLSPQQCAIWYQAFSEGQNITLYDLDQIRWKDPQMYSDLKKKQVKTLVIVPLLDGQEAIGFFGVENPPAEILEDAANMLQIMGHFIVSSMRRRNLVRQLQELSYQDQLTGVGNRHAMWSMVDGFSHDESLGIVYSDVTCLKRVNDEQGHEAGDRLIQTCCQCLVRVFGAERVFRVGGDEIVALLPGIGEQALEEMTQALRANAEAQRVNLAVGGVWQDAGWQSFHRQFTEAEHRMYLDKAEFYRRTGLDRRR